MEDQFEQRLAKAPGKKKFTFARSDTGRSPSSSLPPADTNSAGFVYNPSGGSVGSVGSGLAPVPRWEITQRRTASRAKRPEGKDPIGPGAYNPTLPAAYHSTVLHSFGLGNSQQRQRPGTSGNMPGDMTRNLSYDTPASMDRQLDSRLRTGRAAAFSTVSQERFAQPRLARGDRSSGALLRAAKEGKGLSSQEMAAVRREVRSQPELGVHTAMNYVAPSAFDPLVTRRRGGGGGAFGLSLSKSRFEDAELPRRMHRSLTSADGISLLKAPPPSPRALAARALEEGKLLSADEKAALRAGSRRKPFVGKPGPGDYEPNRGIGRQTLSQSASAPSFTLAQRGLNLTGRADPVPPVGSYFPTPTFSRPNL